MQVPVVWMALWARRVQWVQWVLEESVVPPVPMESLVQRAQMAKKDPQARRVSEARQVLKGSLDLRGLLGHKVPRVNGVKSDRPVRPESMVRLDPAAHKVSRAFKVNTVNRGLKVTKASRVLRETRAFKVNGDLKVSVVPKGVLAIKVQWVNGVRMDRGDCKANKAFRAPKDYRDHAARSVQKDQLVHRGSVV